MLRLCERSSAPRHRYFVLCSLLAAACDGPTTQASPVGGIDAGEADAGLRAPLVGSITLNLREAQEQKPAYSVVSGTLYDGPKPDPQPMRSVMEEGECKLREVEQPFCQEACESDEACVADDACVAYPQPQNVGSIRVTGLDRSELSEVILAPFEPTFFYQSEELPYPACSEGRTLRLQADAVAAEASCVAPLVVSDEAAIPVRRDEPVRLSWERPDDASLATISILLDVSHHGGKRADIQCEVADTGSYEIPALLVNPLLDFGLAGFPSVIVTRKARGTASIHNVELVVVAQVERTVDTGVQSCLQDEDCPQGERCDRATVTCR